MGGGGAGFTEEICFRLCRNNGRETTIWDPQGHHSTKLEHHMQIFFLLFVH